MKTLIQLLDQHQITNPADRLEFEEVVNEVTRRHGAELQSAQLNCDRIVSDTKEQAQSEVTAEREANDALKSELAALREKTQWAISEASSAIGDTSKDDTATVAHISAVIAEVTKDERQRQKEALEASIAAQQAQLAALAL